MERRGFLGGLLAGSAALAAFPISKLLASPKPTELYAYQEIGGVVLDNENILKADFSNKKNDDCFLWNIKAARNATTDEVQKAFDVKGVVEYTLEHLRDARWDVVENMFKTCL